MKKLSEMQQCILVAVVLAVLTAAVYWPVSDDGLTVLDDDDYVARNGLVQAGLTWDGVVWAFTTDAVANWHPVTWLSHMLDCQLFGMNIGAHHLTSLLLHIVNALLLFWVLTRATGAHWPSAFVAALFALHPIHVESVAWVAERKDVLSTFFWLLAMAAYVSYAKRPGVLRYVLVAVPFALGLMAKPMVVTLPCVLLLMDYWPLGRLKPLQAPTKPPKGKKSKKGKSPGQRSSSLAPYVKAVVEKIPLFAMTLASSAITFVVQQRGGAVRSLGTLSLPVRVGNAAVTYVRYLVKTVWPWDLSIYYPHLEGGAMWGAAAVAVILLGAVTFAAIRWRREHPYLLVGWLWYLGTLVPVIGLVQVGSQAMADRYTYVPLIGVFVMVAWGVGRAVDGFVGRGGGQVSGCRRDAGGTAGKDAGATNDKDIGATNARDVGRARLGLGVLAAGVIVILSGLTVRQVGFWQDSVRLFGHALAAAPENNDFAHFNLGIALKREGQLDEAYEQFEKAVAIRENYTNAHLYLGLIRYEQGRYDEAIAHYNRALEFAAGHPNHADLENDLGAAYQAKGDAEEAAKHYRKAVQLDPHYANGHYNLANTLVSLGQHGEAMRHLEETLRLAPGHGAARESLERLKASAPAEPAEPAQEPLPDLPEPKTAADFYEQGNLLAEKQRFADAARYYREALERKPDYVDARVNLGNAFAAQGQLREALGEYLAVLEKQPRNVDVHINVGNVYHELGDLAKAQKAYEQALKLNPAHADGCFSLGYVLAKQGKLDEAEELFAKVLVLQPGSERAQEALRNIEAYRKRK